MQKVNDFNQSTGVICIQGLKVQAFCIIQDFHFAAS